MDNNQQNSNTQITTPTPLGTSDKNENIFLGLVGAILGSSAGAIVIVLLDRIGFVAAISGIVMAICTISLYRKFAKGFSVKGLIICVIVMIIMTLIAENIAISLAVLDAFKKIGIKSDFWTVFSNLYKLIGEYDLFGTYIGSLVLAYVFTVLGAFGTVKSSLNDGKKPAAKTQK